MTSAPVLSLDRVSRRYRGVAAVDGVSLDVAAGEFFSLLGPSGCGKTTTLRLIAGFEAPEPDGGTIRMLGETVNDRRPYQRPIGMVFQNYALFPHLSVAQNVAFGLEERRVAKAEIRARVGRALGLVRLDAATYAGRKPSELSGGQRQRVALARALVLEPAILLLDEPLAALDLQLRKEMQVELKQLNRDLGITFVLVTHDQQEALAMSDRIGVMSGGKLVQTGTPSEIYQRPRNAFVAGFIGETNIVTGTVAAVTDSLASIRTPGGTEWRVHATTQLAVGETAQVAVRPEWLELAPESDSVPTTGLRGEIRETLFRGDALLVVVDIGDNGLMRVAVRNDVATRESQGWHVGQRVVITWRDSNVRLLEQ